MTKIKVLNDKLMNMIAAGEVVERPAGIVKELVENAIDADASKIEINVIDGGIDLIHVVDNGRGMSREDAVLAFERHATSKIHREQDLWSIGTLGFRGEAIPSIASVSKFELITNNGSDSTLVQVNYGEMKDVEVIGANRGTEIKVTGLFYQTPARLKHLKSIAYEMAIITANIEKFALSHPDIAFVLKNDSKEVFRTRGNNNLLEVMFQIYGGDVARSAIEFKDKDADFRVEGLLALPNHTRANRNHILVFINDRMIRDYQITNAIIRGYEAFIPSDRFPIAIVKIYTDFKLVDVNVHPSKWQVRISKEDQLRKFISNVISDSLASQMQAPKLRKVSRFQKPEQRELDFQIKKPNFNEVTNVSEQTTYVSEEARDYSTKVEEISSDDSVTKEKVVEDTASEVADNNFPNMTLIGQMHGKYILASDDDALYIIDQHAAEERVNFEKINHQLAKRTSETTTLLVPEMIELNPSALTNIAKYQEILSDMGIHFDVFSESSLVVREIPLWLKASDLNKFMNDLIEYISIHDNVTELELRKDVIATKACHSSIRFNRNLSNKEMQQVIDNLSRCEQPFHCPHGRPTFIKIEEQQLVKEFLR